MSKYFCSVDDHFMKINTKNNSKTFSLFNLLMVVYFQSRESSTGSDTAYTNWI